MIRISKDRALRLPPKRIRYHFRTRTYWYCLRPHNGKHHVSREPLRYLLNLPWLKLWPL